MTHLNSSLYSTRWMLALLVVFPLLALSANHSGAANALLAQGTDATAGGTAPAIAVTFGSGAFNLAEPKVGLSDLSSYQATLILSFNGTSAGQPQAWSKTYVMLADQKAATRQLTIDTAGDVSGDATSAATSAATGTAPAQVFMAEVNGTQYQRQGQDACTALVADKNNSLAENWEPAGFLSSAIGADAAGTDIVNGVAVNHYTFDERALGPQASTQSKGELWVATDGGYLVKYSLTTTGKADYFGDNSEGTLTWDYELTNVNQPVAIKLPADCPAGSVNAPLLPDSTDEVNQPGLLSYSSVTSVADAVAFYQTKLPTLGWQLHTEAYSTTDAALLDLSNGDQGMLVIITAADGKTTVQITLGAAPVGTNVPTTVPSTTPKPTRTPAPTKTKAPTRTPTNTKTPKSTLTPIPTK
jgi:hypothetical protein